jgi:glycosyltransferase involved in cell wall biosynthesis
VSPRVSVVVPAYNAAATLRRAIDSLLAQTVSELEVIVVDDGSEDGTRELALRTGDPRVRYLHHDHVGLPRTLNVGLAEAQAPVVAVQDADDWSEPVRLERQLALLEARPEVAVVGSRMREVDAHGNELRRRAAFVPGELNDVLMRFNPISNPCAAFRREVVVELGGYDPRYGCAPEYDLWLRVADRHVVFALEETLAVRTLADSNLSVIQERRCIGDSIKLRLQAMRRRRSLRGLPWIGLAGVSYVTPLPVKRAVRRRLGQAP